MLSNATSFCEYALNLLKEVQKLLEAGYLQIEAILSALDCVDLVRRLKEEVDSSGNSRIEEISARLANVHRRKKLQLIGKTLTVTTFSCTRLADCRYCGMCKLSEFIIIPSRFCAHINVRNYHSSSTSRK
jgi:hypothetical protein